MKKILILLGLITSFMGVGQALGASADQNLTCALVEDAANEGKFSGLGYEIARFDIVVTGSEATLTVVQRDGVNNAVGGVGTVDAQDATMFIGWDYNEHWAELTQEGDTFEGTVTVEEDFAFAVTCQENL